MTEPEPYRRGLTLGLTVAEILILLLFLLLLALYAFNAENEVKSEQLQTELETVKKKFDEERSALPETIRQLKRENKSLKKDLEDVQKENTISKALIDQTEKELDQYREKYEQDLEKLETIKKEKERELQETRQENDQLRVELYSSKGIDPPCWYKVIGRRGKRHEKPYYLLDIAVHDEHLRVRLRTAPPGRAIDERDQPAPTNYAEEYAKLPLALDTTRNLSIQELEEFARPIRRMGKNKQIRNYSCVFYVKVWDLTSDTAKQRWQQAEDAIKNWFYTYRVRNDPWESANAT